jgi:transcriptional regulator GlxA family with amidase domain
MAQDRIAAAATYLFRLHGAISMSQLAHRDFIGLRQFERRFEQETGASPKSFARVARFQAALDAKLAAPGRTWLDIAHTFGYYDQMHMIRDFERLGRNTPTHLIAEIGDVRPPALASADRHN